MRLKRYLAARGESQSEFARRCDPPLAQKTLNRVCLTDRCKTTEHAYIIIRATHAEPAPGGGVVTIEDLIPEELVA